MHSQPIRHGFSPWQILWGLAIVFVLTIMVPMSAAYSAEPAAKQGRISVANPGAQLWRDVRGATTGISQVRGPEAGVLVNSGGQDWRMLRNDRVKTYGGWALFLLLVGIVIYHGLHGPIRLENGRSGQVVDRWSVSVRTIHWYTAILFIIMALTGLSIMFGRTLLLPLMGPEGFGAWAQFCKSAHNYLGPAFALGVIATMIAGIRINLPAKGDMEWLIKGGGFFGSEHVPAGKLNAGEKLFTYWVLFIVGGAVCVTGLILDFPNFGQTRETMQFMSLIHGISTVIWAIFVIAHIYLSTACVEGTFDAMWEGRVDVNWAKQHHDLWYQEVANTVTTAREQPATDFKQQPT